LETRYNLFNNYVSRNIAVWDGVSVGLSATFRQGRQRARRSAGEASRSISTFYYEIERWGVSASACSAATSQLAAAEANLVTANNNLIAAQNALAVANAALPADDSLRLLDVCGKRVESCKLRFPYVSLPYGGFPGANTVRQ
jgi:hypothetical protein